jgi:hypothetical protein
MGEYRVTEAHRPVGGVATRGASQYPVRSVDGGRRWVAAGPQLSSDWAGGSLYEVTTVIGEGAQGAVMVSHSVIDVTIDGGRQWYQYLHVAANWTISRYRVRGGVGLRVGPARFARLPRRSYALYVLDVARHQWRRVAQSLHGPLAAYIAHRSPGIDLAASMPAGVLRHEGWLVRRALSRGHDA